MLSPTLISVLLILQSIRNIIAFPVTSSGRPLASSTELRWGVKSFKKNEAMRTSRFHLHYATNNVKYDTSKKGGTTSLHFIGEKIYKSEPVAILHTNEKELSSFLSDDKFPMILFNVDGDNEVELLPNEQANETIYKLWEGQCASVGGEYPNAKDAIFTIKTGGMNFSGLKIRSNSLIGVKYLNPFEYQNEDKKTTKQPEYQLVFIKDSRFVEGPRLLIWIFNQLTGAKGKQKDKEEESTVRSISRFTCDESPDGKTVEFTIKSKLEIVVEFPSILLKILPVSKEKAEEQGSASVLKTMGKDIEAVLPHVRQCYCEAFDENKV